MAAKKKKVTKKKAAKRKSSPTKKAPTKAIGGRTKKNPLTKMDNVTITQIDNCAKHVYTKIIKLSKPELKFPVRSLSNVRYDRRVGHFQLGRSRKARTLTVNTFKNFAQTLKLMSFSMDIVH